MTHTIAPPEPTVAPLGVTIAIEDDATPIVRLIGRTLRDSVHTGHASAALDELRAVVAVRSHDTPQAATVAFSGGSIAVSNGVSGTPDATVTVDLNGRFASVGEPDGDSSTAAAVLDALAPPLPHWQEAADSFWAAARSIRGIPDVLVVIAADDDGNIEQHVAGAGESQYLIAGPPELLAGIFSGADDLLAALMTGQLGLSGTMSQLSVLTAASWKVRYDV
ncbi:hypothetical protein HH308_05420 [Gordonia sp. TBRC 11910]|uniref:Uncharacterized protein n=1 Tax=Gordonia asplenii TaxID=2725283 RepID=A0A848KNN0_9ACTN|nr:hypothetical protein [Gordonia asplenii]NMO00654.1 hypothetical protein [Gordonia asplenii]